MTRNNRLILIDGSGFIFRAYYAIPSMNRSDGTPINAVYGFTNMLVKLIEDYNLDKMIVVFDAARNNFRNKIYNEYKANRGAPPDDLIPQFSLIRDAVKAFKIPQIEIDGYEADDIIASYTNNAKDLNIETLVVSSDKDLMQLVTDKVTMLDPIKNKIIKKEQVLEKFGVMPEKVTQVQALIGDSVDNIPGARGIGPKTAADLIKEFSDVNNLIKNYKKIKQERKQKLVYENSKNILLSLKLVSLESNIDLPISIDNISPYSQIEDSSVNIFEFLNKQGFKSTLKRLENNKIFYKDKTIKKTKDIKIKYKKILNDIDLEKIIESIKLKGCFSFDTETDSLDIEKANLIGFSLCYDESESYYIPVCHQNIKTGKIDKTQIDKKIALKLISSILEDQSILKIGQNIKYDIRIMNKENIKINCFEDTMLMSYALENGLIRHNLDALALRHIDYVTIKYKDLVGSGKKELTFDKVSIDEATRYAAEDAIITFKLYNLLELRVKKEKVNFIYEKIDKPLVNILASMEKNGIKINKVFLNKLNGEFNSQVNMLEKKIFKITKKQFNLSSPKQLGEVLFDDLKIGSGKKTKTGSYSTNSSVLEELSFKGHKIADLLLSWRELSKLKSTYTESLNNKIDSNTNRVHTSYGLASTITGRLSSNDPNLQNIPIRTENGKKIRNAFIPDKNFVLVSFDYSQIELRIAAEMSKDNNLISAFKNNEDVHLTTASQIFNLKKDKISDDLRRQAKAINFGIIYGISSYGLAKQLGIPNYEAKKYIESYFDRFPKIKSYMEKTIEECKKLNYVKTLFGRKCFIKGINDKNFSIRGFAERQSINAPIQGSASDIIKLAMIKIYEAILNGEIEARMLLQVHDELVFEINESATEDNIFKIRQIMENAHLPFKSMQVPLRVDYGIGKNWGEAH